jgi:hypothetical protein
MNAIFKACLLSMLLLIALSSVVHADNLPAPLMSDPKFAFLTPRSGDDFDLRYNSATVTDIPGIATMVMAAQDDINRFFGSYQHHTTIAIAGTNSEFRLFVNVGDAPDTARALNWNVGYNGLIIIKSPTLLSDFETVLAHQIARIAVRTRMNTTYQSLPEWFQDGMASCAADDLTQAQRAAVTVKAVTGHWMSLDDIERAYKNMSIYNYDVQENRDARSQAAALVDNIASLYGSKTLVGIIDDYTVTGNLTGAFINRTSFTPDALNVDLMNTLSGNTTASASPSPTATGTNTGKTGNSASPKPSPTSSPKSSPTAVPAEHESQNVTDTVPAQTAGSWSLPSMGDMILYGAIAAVNIAGVIVVVLILRRNWH